MKYYVIRYVVGFTSIVLHPSCTTILFCSTDLESCKEAMKNALCENGMYLAIVERDMETGLVNKTPIFHQ